MRRLFTTAHTQPRGVSNHMPFSQHLLELYNEFKKATTKEQRRELFFQIASQFHQEWDATEFEVVDDYHRFFEDYERARMEYDQQAQRLARLGLHFVSEFLEQNADMLPQLELDKLSN